MARVLNPSDIFSIRSDRHAICVVRRATQTSPPARAWPAPDRADTARFTDRGLQALWPSELPLRRWTRAWSEALSVHNQANRRATPAWLVPNATHAQVSKFLGNFHKLQQMLN